MKLINIIKEAMRFIKIDLLITKIVTYGVKNYLIENPYFYSEIKTNFQKQSSFDLLKNANNIGVGVRFNGAIKITELRGIVIGNNVHVGDNAYFFTRGGLIIGDNTHISRNVSIYTANHNYIGNALPYDSSYIDKPVVIEKNVWIGMNVCITPGVRIGEGAVIGMGAVIAKNVPAFQIVGQPPYRVINNRNKSVYNDLVASARVGGKNGELTTLAEKKSFYSPISVNSNAVFFVVGTGRCGSTTIAKTLSQHENITCLHEPKLQLIRLSTQVAHREISQADAIQELYDLYLSLGVFPNCNYGESDQKLSNMIDLLGNLLPHSKFIWLIRNPIDTVNSMYSRGWFTDEELFKHESDTPITDVRYKPIYGEHRLHADKVGEMSSREWRKMSPFARNCWYWSYWNRKIDKQLAELDKDRWLQVKLEDLNFKKKALFEFLGENLTLDLPVEKTNQPRNYSLQSPQEWDNDMRSEFLKFCGMAMKEWYPEVKI